MIQGMKFRLIVLFLLPLSVQANDIYRSVDKEGNVDEPDTKAELIELEELTNYEAAPLPIFPIENSAPPEEAAAQDVKKSKYKISITSPHLNRTRTSGLVVVF
jgi:hypothetical protein